MPPRSRRHTPPTRAGTETGVPKPTMPVLALAYAVAPPATDRYLSAFPR